MRLIDMHGSLRANPTGFSDYVMSPILWSISTGWFSTKPGTYIYDFLEEFYTTHGLSIMNTMLTHKQLHLYTWYLITLDQRSIRLFGGNGLSH